MAELLNNTEDTPVSQDSQVDLSSEYELIELDFPEQKYIDDRDGENAWLDWQRYYVPAGYASTFQVEGSDDLRIFKTPQQDRARQNGEPAKYQSGKPDRSAFLTRDRSNSAPLISSRLRQVVMADELQDERNSLPDWASMTVQNTACADNDRTCDTTKICDAARPSSLYIPKGTFDWADDDENGTDDYTLNLVEATSITNISSNAEVVSESSVVSQPSISEEFTEDDEASAQNDENSDQNFKDSAHDAEDVTQGDEEQSDQDDDHSGHDDQEACRDNEKSSQEESPECLKCAELLFQIADLEDDILARDADYAEMSDSFAKYGAETQREIENARSIKKSVNYHKREIARLATKNTALETENRQLKRDRRSSVTHLVEKLMAQQLQDTAKYKAERDEVWSMLKTALADGADAQLRAQSESEARLKAGLDLQETLDMAEEMKAELIENEAELEILRKENAEIKQERDQLKLDISALNVKVSQVEELVASIKNEEPSQIDLAREDAMRQSLDILIEMLSVVEKQQKLQKKRMFVLPTAEVERLHRERLVELGVYAY
jgi:hypothetical protein